jgi:hypothetical protein
MPSVTFCAPYDAAVCLVNPAVPCVWDFSTVPSMSQMWIISSCWLISIAVCMGGLLNPCALLVVLLDCHMV